MTTTIDDLPNELLDEIFAYLYARIPIPKGWLVKTVCRRWNRPFMTTHLASRKMLPKHVHLQLDFPQLMSICVDIESLKNFKGHASLQALAMLCYNMPREVPSYSFILSNCPRLTRLALSTKLSIFLRSENIAALMALCPSLIEIFVTVDIDKIMDNKMMRILKTRSRDYQGLLKLKTLTICINDDDEFDDLFYELDLVAFCSIFQAPSLETLQIDYYFVSPEEQSTAFSLFPKVKSIEIDTFHGTDRMDATHGIFEHVVDLKFNQGHANLASILKQFPNLVSLHTGASDVVFVDVMHPTQIRNLRMSNLNLTMHMWKFPCLEELVFKGAPYIFNGLMHELGLHCPQLAKITLCMDQGQIDPDFGVIKFPRLAKFYIVGTFVFNESFTQFVARHPTLESLEYESHGKYQEELTLTDSEMILWPNLVSLKLVGIGPESTIPRLHWFLKNSPNLTHLAFDMGSYKPVGSEGEISLYCPKLKYLDYTGKVSGHSLTEWARTGNWNNTMEVLRLNIKLEQADILLLFEFLRTLSHTDDVRLALMPSHWKQPDVRNVVYSNVSVLTN